MPQNTRTGRKPKLDLEQSAALKERFATGESINSLAEIYGISEMTVRRMVKGLERSFPPGSNGKAFWACCSEGLAKRDYDGVEGSLHNFQCPADQKGRFFCSSECFESFRSRKFPIVSAKGYTTANPAKFAAALVELNAKFFPDAEFGKVDEIADFLEF